MTIDIALAATLFHDSDYVRRCRKYGVTIADAVRTYMRQEQGCGICGVKSEIRALVFDHNHRSGRFRGLLCSQCNTGIGLLGDSETTLRKALGYLVTQGSYGTRDLPGITADAALAWLAETASLASSARHLPSVRIQASDHRKFHILRQALGVVGECELCLARDADACASDCPGCAQAIA